MNPLADLPRSDTRPADPMARIRVFTACADTMFRRGVAAVLAEEPAFAWAGEAASAEQALAQAPALLPDLVLIDADLPGSGAGPATGAGAGGSTGGSTGTSSLATLQALRLSLPRARFAMLFAQIKPETVRAAVAAGVACVLDKSATQAEMVAAMQAVHSGIWAHSEAVTRALTAPHAEAAQPVRLTPREHELLSLMAQGLTNSDISRRLCIAMPTVKFHVGHIMAKLGVENRTAAVLSALRGKLVDLDEAELPTTAHSQDAAPRR